MSGPQGHPRELGDRLADRGVVRVPGLARSARLARVPPRRAGLGPDDRHADPGRRHCGPDTIGRVNGVASVREVLARERAGGSVTVRGWLRTTRHSKGVSFLELSDGSCFAGLQVVAEPALPNYESEVAALGTGCAVSITGEVVDSPGKGQRFELRATRVEVVGGVAPDYPLQKKRHSFEFLRTIAHLRPRTNTIGAVLRVRSAATLAIHQFFAERGFLCLHTPVITASDAEGAGELFRVTTIDPSNPPRDAERWRRLGRGLLRPRGVPDRVGPARGRDRRARAHERLHVRADVPRRELEHEPPSRRVLDDRARDGVLRPRGQHGPRRGVPEVRCSPRCSSAAPTTSRSSTSASTTRVIATLEHVVERAVRAHDLQRGDRDPREAAAARSSFP